MTGLEAPGRRKGLLRQADPAGPIVTLLSAGVGLDRGRHLGSDRRKQASGPNDDDDHRVRQSSDQGIQCYDCGGMDIRPQCRRGREGRPRGFPRARNESRRLTRVICNSDSVLCKLKKFPV
jgi:hypothetical protein